jgi:hypothetical protein
VFAHFSGGNAMNKKKPSAEQPEHPKGALAVTLIYLATIVVLWSWVYQTLLERGVTR